MRTALRCLVPVAGILLGAGPAEAERVIAALSTDRVAVASNFTGTVLALLGAIGPDERSATRRGGYDAVVIVRGPSRTQMVYRKDRLGPIWVNRESRTYVGAPVFYAVLSNRPLREAMLEPLRAEMQVGLDMLRLTQRWERNDPAMDRRFREAFLDLRGENGSYGESDGDQALHFLAPNVFRARIVLPADVPIGFYTVEVLVLSEGFVVGRDTASFRVEKNGFEAAMFAASRDAPLLYGLATVALALGSGWIAALMFRRG